MNHNTQNLDPNQRLNPVEIQTSSFRTHSRSSLPSSLTFGAIGLGLLAGIVGVASMSLHERSFRPLRKDEKKSNAVPAEKMEKLFRKSEKMGSSGWVANRAIHLGEDIFARILKPVVSRSNLQATIPSFLFTGVRLSTDQILENLLRTGPQKNMSKYERRMDLFHRAAYAFATGFFADLLFKSRNRPMTNIS